MDRAELIALVQATSVATQRGDAFFLSDPEASATERAQAEAVREQALQGPADRGWLCIATGGSSGRAKFARHDEDTLTAAVRGFCAHFQLERVNAIDVLPPHHVSGLMARVRCAATGGCHVPWSWKKLQAGEVPTLTGEPWMISLVPSQLQRLLSRPAAVDWLRRFKIIFLGGGPTWPQLADDAARARLPISLSYGMTETAAMIAASRPEEFLAGDRSSGAAMPHARIEIASDGVVRVAGESVFHGYHPAWIEAREFTTEDLGRIDPSGRLHVLGRRDAVIITGGKKVNPTEVEAALLASGQFRDVVVIGVPDAEWGEAVVACYPADTGAAPDLSSAVQSLAGYQRPKRFVALAEWPRNALGKVNRTAVRAAVLSDKR